jgi:hypothetical protein
MPVISCRLSDVEEGRLLGGVQRFDDDAVAGLVGEVLRQVGGAMGGEHDGLGQIEQCALVDHFSPLVSDTCRILEHHRVGQTDPVRVLRTSGGG